MHEMHKKNFTIFISVIVMNRTVSKFNFTFLQPGNYTDSFLLMKRRGKNVRSLLTIILSLPYHGFICFGIILLETYSCVSYRSCRMDAKNNTLLYFLHVRLCSLRINDNKKNLVVKKSNSFKMLFNVNNNKAVEPVCLLPSEALYVLWTTPADLIFICLCAVLKLL